MVVGMEPQKNTSTKLKVVLVTPVPPPHHGGIANWTRIISRGLADISDVEPLFVDTSVRVRSAVNTSWPIRLVGGSIQGLRDTYRLYGRLKADRPDVVHICTSGGPAALKDLLMLRLAAAFGAPCVLHYHMGRMPGIIARGGSEWKLIRQAMLRAGAVVLLDQKSEEAVTAVLPGVTEVRLPNMVEIDAVDVVRNESRASSAPNGPAHIVFVGHVVPNKGMRELVTACVRLRPRPMVLDVVGPVAPAFRDELQAIAQSAGEASWLQMHGSLPHHAALQRIAQADLVVLPSYTEGMPTVVLEAMACGKAIVSTTVGAVAEMLDIGGPEQCGVCVAPRDVDALTAAIARMLDRPDERNDLGCKGRQRAEKHYSVPVGCGQLVELWRSVSRNSKSNLDGQHNV
jgi:glycosyltransferase involved in cell wall biosynthesis